VQILFLPPGSPKWSSSSHQHSSHLLGTDGRCVYFVCTWDAAE